MVIIWAFTGTAENIGNTIRIASNAAIVALPLFFHSSLPDARNRKRQNIKSKEEEGLSAKPS
jgi:hypothetical protein